MLLKARLRLTESRTQGEAKKRLFLTKAPGNCPVHRDLTATRLLYMKYKHTRVPYHQQLLVSLHIETFLSGFPILAAFSTCSPHMDTPAVPSQTRLLYKYRTWPTLAYSCEYFLLVYTNSAHSHHHDFGPASPSA